MAIPHATSDRLYRATNALAPFYRFFEFFEARNRDPASNNFAFGNPQEMPLKGFVTALQDWSTPQDKDWFAYKLSEESARETVAATLRAWRGASFEADDILMTNGGFAAIAVALNTVVSLGEEVIYVTPPWFFYEAMIYMTGARPVRVPIRADTFDLDLAAIEAALTERTRAIIVNSPNNPTGKIYPPETLQGLADLLTQASERQGRPVYLLSDEAYSRIIFDNRPYHSATSYYPYSFLLYTYGKTLLTPGQRIGYIALPPAMPDRATMREHLFAGQLVTGFAFPNALLQHALADLEKLSIDVSHLEDKRNWLVDELSAIGYEVHAPEGTFYLLPRSPLADDWAYAMVLAEHDILCLPGSIVEMPGYFRLSLTASDEMIERALPGFRRAFERAARERAAA
jgi:aspartate aminotransferase